MELFKNYSIYLHLSPLQFCDEESVGPHFPRKHLALFDQSKLRVFLYEPGHILFVFLFINRAGAVDQCSSMLYLGVYGT